MSNPAITKLLEEWEYYQRINVKYKNALKRIYRSLSCVGGPLNDNIAGYTKEQLLPFFKIQKLVDDTLELEDWQNDD